MYIELESVEQSLFKVLENRVLATDQCQYICQYVEDPNEGFVWTDAPIPPSPNDRLELNPEQYNAKHKAGVIRPDKEFDELYSLVKEPLKQINDEFFHFDLVGARSIQIHKFEVGDERPCCTDLFLQAPKSGHRKLVLYIDLNADFEGGRVYLKRGTERMNFDPIVGKGVAIPSYQLYGVEPVKRGTAYKLAIWGCGERFK